MSFPVRGLSAVRRKPLPPTPGLSIRQVPRESVSVRVPTGPEMFTNGPTKDGSNITTTRIPEWPHDGALLLEDVQATGWKILFGLFDVFTALSPVLFIVLAVSAFQLDSQPVDGNQIGGDRILKAIKLGPTIYPIVFAAVAGRSLTMIARYRAERGERLGILEQLMASHTLFGTIESQVFLRMFGWLGMALIALWALSPLGGQASLRLVSISSRSSDFRQTVRYFSTNQSTVLYGASSAASYANFVSSIYTSSFLAAARTANDPLDIWGNLRIPRIETLTSKADSDGWKSVPKRGVAFSSLVGLPLIKANTTKNTRLSFTMQSSYMKWDVQKIVNESRHGDWEQTLGTPWRLSNGTVINPFMGRYGSGQTIFLDTPTPFTEARLNGTVDTPRYVLFGSQADIGDTIGVVLANSTVTQTRVESRVLCEDGSCRVTDMRPSKEDRFSTYFTPLELGSTVANLFKAFAIADGYLTGSGRSQPTESYIETLNYTLSAMDYAHLHRVVPQDFSDRLGLLFNTFFTASLAPIALTGGASQSMDAYLPESVALGSLVVASQGGSDTDNIFLSRLAPATATITERIYTAHADWVALLLLSSSLLFLLGIVGLSAKYTSLAPEILGFVSSMTRDSEYFAHIGGGEDAAPGSTLDGYDRARLLKEVRVQVIDVEGKADVGRIALVPVGERSGGEKGDIARDLERLHHGRMYR